LPPALRALALLTAATCLLVAGLPAEPAPAVPPGTDAPRGPRANWPAAAARTTASDVAAPGDTTYYFYRQLGYGSDSLISPTRLITNGGFGILKMENRSNRLADVNWENGWRNLWRTLASPIETIDRLGWGEFVTSELLPFSTGQGNAQYWPNYTNHLLGGGMSYRMMREWYRAHGFQHERSWALLTITAYHLLNETVEMNAKSDLRADPVADVYIFNTAGILLFESATVSRFFSNTLNMADWSFQPLYDPAEGTIENQGQNYMMRLRLGSSSPWYAFYHWGNSGEGGFSRHLGGGRHVSLGVGLVAKSLVDVDGLSETADLATSFGLFYDRRGSLLASVLYAESRSARWRLNLYPGLLDLGRFDLGLTFLSNHRNDITVGLTLGTIPLLPAGLGHRIGQDRDSR
jgi:hypothetical protein